MHQREHSAKDLSQGENRILIPLLGYPSVLFNSLLVDDLMLVLSLNLKRFYVFIILLLKIFPYSWIACAT